jgi:hypothetical protein
MQFASFATLNIASLVLALGNFLPGLQCAGPPSSGKVSGKSKTALRKNPRAPNPVKTVAIVAAGKDGAVGSTQGSRQRGGRRHTRKGWQKRSTS